MAGGPLPAPRPAGFCGAPRWHGTNDAPYNAVASSAATSAHALGAATRGEGVIRVNIPRLVFGAVLLGSLMAAGAQSSPTPAEKSAMERAQREADGPRRRILEAAKVKGIVKSEPPGSTPVVNAATVAPAGDAAASAAASPVAGKDDTPRRELVIATLPAADGPLPSTSAAVEPLPTVAPLTLPAATVALIAMPPKIITLTPPRLLSRVDPELPSRFLRRRNRRTEVMVDMTIAPDGSVHDVTVRNAIDDELATVVRDAVSQWRYNPQPVSRPHTVQLILGDS